MVARTRRRELRIKISGLARRMGVLGAVDWLRFQLICIRNRRANAEFERIHPGFPMPPKHLAYDAFGTVDWEYYREAGAKISSRIQQIVTRYRPRTTPLQYLEWGCGPACVIRHMPALLPAGSRVAGSDYNEETIAWCRGAFTGIEFQVNQLSPPLPFRDAEFDVVCGLSVVTHLSEALCKAWLVELERVTRPGGLAILTVKGDSQVARLSAEEEQKIRRGEIVVRARIDEGKRLYDTVIPVSYMRRIIPGAYVVREHVPDGMPEYQQDLWVLEKSARPEHSPSGPTS